MFAEKNDMQMDDFKLGRPALVCRWRLFARSLPIENRHLRALGNRRVKDAPVSPQLVAWAKQHIEWTLYEGALRCPDGVLMVVVDDEGRAAMTVGPYEPLAVTTVSALAGRALGAAREAARTGVAPETLWVVRDERLVWGGDPEWRPSGATSLVADLARTLGLPVSCEGDLVAAVMDGSTSYDEVFLVSDEHGVVPASNAPGPKSSRLSEGWCRLLESVRRPGRGGSGMRGV